MLSESDLEVLDAIRRYRNASRTGAYRTIRKRFGITIATVAEAVGVSKVSIGHYETGRRVPSGDVAIRYGQFMEELDRRMAETDAAS